jgi:hypothetical protein
MTPEQIHQDVERGIVIKYEIEQLTIELKHIEKRLEQAGLHGQQIPLENAEREGKQYLAKSAKHIVPVVFESDMLIKSFPYGSPLHHALDHLCGGENFKTFFDQKRTFERSESDGHVFRKDVFDLMEDNGKSHRIIGLLKAKNKDGIIKSRTVIDWKNTKNLQP